MDTIETKQIENIASKLDFGSFISSFGLEDTRRGLK